MSLLSVLLNGAQALRGPSTGNSLPKSAAEETTSRAKKAAARMNQSGRTEKSHKRPSLDELKQKAVKEQKEAEAAFQNKKEKVNEDPKHYLKKISNQQMSLTPFKVNEQQARELVQTGIDSEKLTTLKLQELDPGQLGELLSSICTEPADKSQIFEAKDLERMDKILDAAEAKGCLNEVVNYTRDNPDGSRSESPLERIVHSNQNNRTPNHDVAMGKLLGKGAEVTGPMKRSLLPKRSLFWSSTPIQYTENEQNIKNAQTRQEKIKNAEQQITQFYENGSPIPGDTSFDELIKRDVLGFVKTLKIRHMKVPIRIVWSTLKNRLVIVH